MGDVIAVRGRENPDHTWTAQTISARSMNGEGRGPNMQAGTLGKDYVTGKQFTVADGYLFVMLKWAERTGMDLSEFKNLMAFNDRVAARPNVQAALKMEGLLKAA